MKLNSLSEALRLRIQKQIQDEDRRKIPHAVPQRDQAPALDRPVSGAGPGIQRIVVRFTGYRVHPLDPDNFAGGVKDLLDGLRHAAIIPGDEPWRIELQTFQEKVGHYCEERIVIEINP
jgi:hypothetical protein